MRVSVTTVVDNPMPHRLPEGENAAPLEVIGTTASDKLVIIMVGLPATGTNKEQNCARTSVHTKEVAHAPLPSFVHVSLSPCLLSITLFVALRV
jgi:hypothetical protein